jgi:hypothetical protein
VPNAISLRNCCSASANFFAVQRTRRRIQRAFSKALDAIAPLLALAAASSRFTPARAKKHTPRREA